MNIKRFTARTSREALGLVRLTFGNDAVVLSTRPCEGGVEVLAMGAESMADVEQAHAAHTAKLGMKAGLNTGMNTGLRGASHDDLDPEVAARTVGAPVASIPSPRKLAASSPREDAQALAMSTLSFQDYVRERMLRRRQAELEGGTLPSQEADAADESPRMSAATARGASARSTPQRPVFDSGLPVPPSQADGLQAAMPTKPGAPKSAAAAPAGSRLAAARAGASRTPRMAPEEVPMPPVPEEAPAATAELEALRREREAMVSELRSMKGLIEQRFAALSFTERLQRQPEQARLAHRLMELGFSPALTRKLVDALPAGTDDEMAWAAEVLARNIHAAEHEPALEDHGGVFALIGSTGVGKTTTTAKIAANFAARHGASQLGLITLDAYRVGAHEQLRAYGRILGVPVHTAHDRASLEDLLDLLGEKKMVLIDTAGMAQRDSRTRELLDMVSHRSIQRLLVVNAAAQGETLDDVMVAWRASACRGVVLSKIDEAVRLAPALDAVIRHKMRVLGVANGQRVPEDWHRLGAKALVQRALRGGGSDHWRLSGEDVQLVLTGTPPAARRAAASSASSGAMA